MIQLACRFVRFQEESALAKWFRARTENARASRKNIIIALARKLLIALWRFVRDGVVPEVLDRDTAFDRSSWRPAAKFSPAQCRGLDTAEIPATHSVVLQPPVPSSRVEDSASSPRVAYRAPCSPRDAPCSFRFCYLFVLMCYGHPTERVSFPRSRQVV